MKHIIYFAAIFMMYSCSDGASNSSNKHEKSSKAQVEQTEQTEEVENVEKPLEAKNECDKFLDTYEVWVNEIVKIYKRVKESPSDMENNQMLVIAKKQMAPLDKKWTKLSDCANNEKYAKRMKELQERVNKAME